MSSGFSGGVPDFFSGSRRAAVLPTSANAGTFNANPNHQQQFSFRSPLAGVPPDPAAQIRRSEFTGKRSLADFQQASQGLGFYLRNVKQRPGNYHHAPPVSPLSATDLTQIPSISPVMSALNPRYGLPVLQQHRLQPLTILNRNAGGNLPAGASMLNSGQNRGFGPSNLSSEPEYSTRDQSEKSVMMSHKLLELEKQLLGDDEEGETVSAVTDSEWSDTIQNLIGPARKPISSSPTSSSSSCSSATPALPCPKQALIDAAAAVSDGRPEAAAEILARFQQPAANPRGTPEQRLAAYMAAALRARVAPAQLSQPEVLGKEHAASTQMLYDASPCFKLGFMAANLAILEATAEQGLSKIHVLDFEIGQGGQYVHLLHALAAKWKTETPNYDGASLRITAVVDKSTAGGAAAEEKLRIVGDGLRALATRIGVPLAFAAKNLEIAELTRENLGIRDGEALAVNLAFRLYRLPDESVTTENLRDETLRRVRGLSPEVVAVVEQELNTNTAQLEARVRDTWEYYGLLLDSLESTLARDSSDRVRIEEGLGRRMVNAVAREGLDRVERCEVFGKWRARMCMAGFEPRRMSRLVVDSLRAKLNSGTRGNPGFSVSEESGGVGFGWMGRNLTVASAWR
ncbi:scarecrow-like transcription factor SCL8-L protein [Striga asiatica]|uniref:Scarecrow-like transcription factor SCL8-L protein n=1 Tax=Striga asiatica TaxID=4170 RepID=A0A5A7QMX4_STRAF|nr:scarecrow-like transcription factor SCL8-L protein [Striga asiatica]